MPPKIESLSELLYLAVGGLLVWLGKVLKDWFRDKTEERRKKVDQVANLELSIQEHREVIFTMRSEMLKSGHFKAEDIPPIPKRK